MKKIIYILLLFISIKGVSQKSMIDSLEKELKTSYQNPKGELSDTIKINLLYKLAFEYIREGNYNRALSLAIKQKALAENLLTIEKLQPFLSILKRFAANSYNIIGAAYKNKSEYSQAIFYHNKAVKIREEIKDIRGLAASYNNLGNVFQEQGNYTKSLESHLKSSKLSEQINDEKGIALSFNNAGLTYQMFGERTKALENMFKSLAINKKIGNKLMEGKNLGNIGDIYHEMGKDTLALDYLTQSLNVRKQISDNPGVASNLNSMSDCFKTLGDFQKAMEYNQEGIKTALEIGNKAIIIRAYNTASEIRLEQIKKDIRLRSKYEKEIRNYLHQAKKLATESGIMEQLNKTNKNYADFEYVLGNYKQSVENYRTYLRVRDSLFNKESAMKVMQTELSYEFEKKEQTAKLEQAKKDIVVLEERNKQKIIRNSFISGFILMLLLAVFIFRSYKNKQKANHIISIQKKEVERQKELVEQKQKQIVDSINYAKRIQESILANDEEIKKHLPDLFVLYLPKDIVSGDFYWFAKADEKEENSAVSRSDKKKQLIQNPEEFILCAADCTGHGVPGAFLSMVGSTLLNEIVNHNKITDPAHIIKELAKGVTNTLVNKQISESNTDGMDISICKINTKQKNIFFAGANHVLYTVNKQGVHITEPQIDCFTGIFGIETVKDIKSTEISVEPSTMVYLSTDGYADQTGEKSNKKFLSSRFEKFLGEIYQLPVDEQKQKLQQNFFDWKGATKQTDDVLVIGFRV